MPAYLDYNASTPIDERVLERMIEVYRHLFGNADSRTHVFGTAAKEIVAQSRTEIAEILSIDKSDLIFTSGSTESNNIAVMGLYRHAIDTGVNAENVLSKVTDKTLLVSVMHVNSETGIIQPVDDIGEELSHKNTYFHIDATQSFGKMNAEIRKLKYDMLSFTGHKFGAPQGIGGFVLRRGSDYKRPPTTPLFFGGQQERGIRPGTTPVALIAGLAKAASICEEEHVILAQKSTDVKSSFMSAIIGLKYEINGDPKYCIPSTINISFTGVDAEGVFVALKDDYAFSNGSACTSGSFAPSYVLTAMGLDEARIASALRLSWDGRMQVDFSNLVKYIEMVV